jgi:hypothetical protein
MSDSEDDSSILEIMEELKRQMQLICDASAAIELQMPTLYSRAKSETTDWMLEPLKTTPVVRAWCKAHSISETPTLDEFMDACFRVAISLDYASRMATFRRADADALWQGQQRISVYDMIERIPGLFC